ncbi:MAG TPA: sigma-70 family RNA polymerase sigma factor [Candidatus Angelobacter sp.]
MSSAACAFDSDYLKALRRGDPAIEAHFVDHFSPILLRTLRRKVRSADQAREVRQETFLRVLAAVRSGRGVDKPERFGVFVIGVCNNIVREIYREQSRCMALSELETEPVADFPSAYALVLAEETRGKVRHMLSQLDVNEQVILEAMFLDEQSKDEICGRLGVSRSYLRVLLYRAKKQFGVRAGEGTLLSCSDSFFSN